ncbi:hypothetical protein [Pontibacter cellulosilyticus]|uniref:Nsp2 transmembrane domain-containing protein n=1 Tax=Pontibacter cellulosilyticus TaxID=1720253 RepID=A0A923N5Y7_9BACT|nr:hypothetical protein [Pontibacter cellulosilyticus]MBC5991517.1 hypothetical protein [Pontibacter cellulosilyticus]
MKEDFNFDKVGKRMPYKVPSDYFDKVTEQTLAEAERRKSASKKPSFTFWSTMAVAASLAILLTVGYFVYTGKTANDQIVAVTEQKSQQPHPETTEKSASVAAAAEPEAAPVRAPSEDQAMAATTQAPANASKTKPQQLAKVEKPETLDDVLANISDEELMLLAAVAETDLNVYEQTFE